MDYTQVIELFKKANLYDLYRVRTAIQNEMEDPERIKLLRQCFAVGDQISYFDSQTNSLSNAIVLEKNQKNVLVQNLKDHRKWNIPYYMLNLSGKESDIKPQTHQKLTKNHLKVGEGVGFDHDGKSYHGIINRLNYKTVSLTTVEGRCYRVCYGMLYKIFDLSPEEQTTQNLINAK